MRKTFVIIMLSIMLLAGLLSALRAQTLPVDARKKEMQFFRDYEYREIAPSDTLWAKIKLPKGTMAVQFLSLVDSVAIAQDSLYTAANSIAGGVPGLVVTKQAPIWLPTYRKTELWIRRAAAATASKVRLIIYKM